MNSATRTLFAFALFSLLPACGLKGPLYLPPEVPETQQEPQAAPVHQEKPAKVAPEPVSTQKTQAKPEAEAPKEEKEEEVTEQETPKEKDSRKKALPLPPPPAPPEEGPSLEEPPPLN